MKLACIQLNSGDDKNDNLSRVASYIEEAAEHGAGFISLPEVFNFRGAKEEAIENAESLEGKSISLLRELAYKHKLWILNGSFFEKVEEESLPYNTSILISPEGEITAKYRKIHLFDVELKDKKIKESEKSKAGREPVVAYIKNQFKNFSDARHTNSEDTELTDASMSSPKNEHNEADGNLWTGFKLGMSICYDLRFPELYRNYSSQKVELIAVPSAFTKVTGLEHWQCLLRARAIENQAYVIAANQCGIGAGVETYGHSMIVDPWGRVLIEASENKEEIIYANMNLDYLYKLRTEVPALEHRLL
jgi:predicted amidohydrolase